MSQYKDDDIQRFIRRETSQQRLRPEQDEAKRREAERIKRELQTQLREMTWDEFEQRIIEIGAKTGTKEYEQFRLLYHEYQKYLSEMRRAGPRRP